MHDEQLSLSAGDPSDPSDLPIHIEGKIKSGFKLPLLWRWQVRRVRGTLLRLNEVVGIAEKDGLLQLEVQPRDFFAQC